MKAIGKIVFCIVFLLVSVIVEGQVSYSTGFEVAAERTQWTGSGFTGTTTYACSGYSMVDNCFGTSGSQIVEMSNVTSLGTTAGGNLTVSFKYKILDWNTNTAAGSADFKELKVYSGASSTGPWTLRYTLSSHTASASCATKSFTYSHPSGDVFLQFTFEHSNVGSPDVDVYFDDISVTGGCNAPSASITKTCDPDFSSYSLSVNVTALGDASSVNITDGTTVYESGVGTGVYSISGLTTAKTIYVEDNADPACAYSEGFLTCDICSDAPSLPTDECVDAPLIDLSQPFVGSTTCTYTVSSNNPGSCGIVVHNDSWIKFIAGDDQVEMDWEVGNCSGGNGVQLAVYGGTCGSLSLLGVCFDPSSSVINPAAPGTGTWTFSGMTIGSTYYIMIDGYAGDLCDYWFTPVSGVVITPGNDLCSDADTLTCGNSFTASNILATATDAPSACSGGGTASKGVWYMLEGTGQEVTVSTDNAGTNFDTDINVFSGSCGSLTCIGGDTDSGTGTTSSYTFTTTSGVDYYVYVDGNGSAEGQFEISLSCASCNANAGVWD